MVAPSPIFRQSEKRLATTLLTDDMKRVNAIGDGDDLGEIEYAVLARYCLLKPLSASAGPVTVNPQ
jgi:hypothetical protein